MIKLRFFCCSPSMYTNGLISYHFLNILCTESWLSWGLFPTSWHWADRLQDADRGVPRNLWEACSQYALLAQPDGGLLPVAGHGRSDPNGLPGPRQYQDGLPAGPRWIQVTLHQRSVSHVSISRLKVKVLGHYFSFIKVKGWCLSVLYAP